MVPRWTWHKDATSRRVKYLIRKKRMEGHNLLRPGSTPLASIVANKIKAKTEGIGKTGKEMVRSRIGVIGRVSLVWRWRCAMRGSSGGETKGRARAWGIRWNNRNRGRFALSIVTPAFKTLVYSREAKLWRILKMLIINNWHLKASKLNSRNTSLNKLLSLLLTHSSKKLFTLTRTNKIKLVLQISL